MEDGEKMHEGESRQTRMEGAEKVEEWQSGEGDGKDTKSPVCVGATFVSARCARYYRLVNISSHACTSANAQSQKRDVIMFREGQLSLSLS